MKMDGGSGETLFGWVRFMFGGSPVVSLWNSYGCVIGQIHDSAISTTEWAESRIHIVVCGVYHV